MTNFVLSSQQACMAQCVDVSNFIPTRYSSAIIRFELSFHFRFSIDTSTMSSVQLIAAVYDSRMNEIASCKKSSVVDADDTDTDGWQIVSHCFAMSRQSRPRFVVLAVMGEQIQQKQQHQREYKRFVWGRHHAAQQQQQQQQRKNNVVKVKHCAVNVFYRNNHRKLFYRDAFDRVCLRLIGPKQPIFQLFVDDAREDEEEDERQKMQKEKERRLQDVVRRGVQPEHLAAANITLPTTQSLQNQQPRLPIVQHDDVAEHLFHQRSFSRISSNTSLSFRSVGTAMSTASSSSGRVNSSSSAEKDRHFLRRGRLSRSFYRGRYRQYD